MNINNPGNAIYGTLKDMPVYLYRGTKKLATSTGSKILEVYEKEDIPEMLPISNHNANIIYATYGDNENELEIFSWDEETSAYKGIGYLEVNNNG